VASATRSRRGGRVLTFDPVRDVRLLSESRVAERSLAVLATGAALAFCYLARELLVPSVVGIILAFTVHPVVAALERRKVPRSVAALLGTLLALAVVAALVALLWNRVGSFLDELPSYEGRLREASSAVARRFVHFRAQTEQIAKPPSRPGAVRVEEGIPWGQVLVGTAQGAIAVAAACTVAVFVLYFALAEGPRYHAKFLAHVGRDPAARVRALEAFEELHRDVEQYMLNRVGLNALLGLVTWAIYALYGLEHAAVWGMATALLHFIPYVGPAIGLALPTLMALLQYGSLKHVLAVGGIYLALVSLQGNVVDPIFLGKQLRLNSLAVFLGSLFWFWVWGPIGLFVAVPVLSTIRIACKYIPRLGFVSDFLAE
jgi:predicted PurR-regulated permease PerM